MSLNIGIRTIPHSRQRYETVGDYQTGYNGRTEIRVSQLSSWQREMLVAVHELVEQAWAMHHGVMDEEIDKFDIEYEKNRPEGDTSEPGDHPDCPVHEGHVLATRIEQMLAQALQVDWASYDAEVNALGSNDSTRDCYECHRPIFENETFFSCPPRESETTRRDYHTTCTIRRP